MQALIQRPGEAALPALPEEMAKEMAAIRGLLATQSAQIGQLTQMLREMVTLTHAQEAELKRTVNERAKALCQQYGLPPDCARKIACRIRTAIAAPSGVRALRDIPRCEYKEALYQAQEYDRPGMLRSMARKEGGGR